MKKIVAFLLIVILGYVFTSFGPWYLIALAGFAGGLVLKNQWNGLLIGFLAGFTLWAVHILILSGVSESDLPARMAQLFKLPNGAMLILVSALVGGLVAGFGAAAGGSVRKVMKSK
jgi:hypothetical protein